MSEGSKTGATVGNFGIDRRVELDAAQGTANLHEPANSGEPRDERRNIGGELVRQLGNRGHRVLVPVLAV